MAARPDAVRDPYFVYFQHPDDGLDVGPPVVSTEPAWAPEVSGTKAERLRGFLAYTRLFEGAIEAEDASVFLTAAAAETFHTQAWPLPPMLRGRLEGFRARSRHGEQLPVVVPQAAHWVLNRS